MVKRTQKFVGKNRRIVWVCLTILKGSSLKGHTNITSDVDWTYSDGNRTVAAKIELQLLCYWNMKLQVTKS